MLTPSTVGSADPVEGAAESSGPGLLGEFFGGRAVLGVGDEVVGEDGVAAGSGRVGAMPGGRSSEDENDQPSKPPAVT
jgi:hypothetical protein